MELHIAMKHLKWRCYRCKIPDCGFSAATMQQIQRHYLCIHNKVYVCIWCEKEFDNLKIFYAHLPIEHSIKVSGKTEMRKIFECTEPIKKEKVYYSCGKKFTIDKEFKRHLQVEHKTKEPLIKLPYEYYEFQDIHHNNRITKKLYQPENVYNMTFSCELKDCKMYDKPQAMNMRVDWMIEHVSVYHLNLKWECLYISDEGFCCREMFGSKRALNMHNKEMHNVEVQNIKFKMNKS